jgi:hypothetical protein
MVPKDSEFPAIKYKTESYTQYKLKNRQNKDKSITKRNQEINDEITSSDSEE